MSSQNQQRRLACRFRSPVWLFAAILFVPWQPIATAQAPPSASSPSSGKTSSARAPAKFLAGSPLRRFENQSRLSVRWSNQTLRAALDSLSQQAAAPHRLAILLDRRVDPGQKIEVSVQDARFKELLDQLAQSSNLAVHQFDSLYYLGPVTAVEKLPSINRDQKTQLRKLEKPRQRALLKRKPMRWEELAEPRDLVKRLAKEGGLTVVGLEKVPHDLWPAQATPPLTLTDRLSLVLFGFDLTYRLDGAGRKIEIIPLAEGN